MEEEIIVAKPKKITLSEVNERLLDKLYNLIENASAEEILQITDSVAKLNSSYKGNDKFGGEESESERLDREQLNTLGQILSGD